MSDDKGQQQAVQTTGHAWDGDIQEFNNPLPRWWLWAFYGTVAFAVIYWFLYPAWPVADSYTKGLFNRITYEVNGEQRSSHWNTRARLIHELQEGEEAVRMREYTARIAAADYEEILNDPDMMAFARSAAKGLFGDNCAACHGAGATGVIGHFPNLADDDWLWGGTPEDIEATIREGRRGFMPAFGQALTDEQIEALADFVLSLSGHEVDAARAAEGRRIFTTEVGGCYYCHGADGTGLESQGAANLTDRIWTVANVPAAEDLEARRQAVMQVIRNGVHREMPAWKGRLTDDQIRLLTVFVHELGGGQ